MLPGLSSAVAGTCAAMVARSTDEWRDGGVGVATAPRRTGRRRARARLAGRPRERRSRRSTRCCPRRAGRTRRCRRRSPATPGRFHALFGRDSLICALQVLPAAPEVARATLRALAARQGTRTDPRDRRGAGQDPARVPHGPGRVVRRGRVARARRRAPVLRQRRLDQLVPDRARPRPATRRWRPSSSPPGARPPGGWPARSRPAAGSSATGRGGRPGGLAQQGWRDAIGPVDRHPEGAGIVRAGRQRARLPAGRRRHPGRRGAPRSTRSRGSIPRAAGTRARRSCGRRLAGWGADVDGAGGRRDAGRRAPGSQLGWLLWARALEGDAAAAAAERLVAPDVLTAVRPAHALRGRGRVRPARLPPRRCLAVRLAGSAGAACARPAAPPRPSGSGPACSTRSTGSAWRRSSTRSTGRATLRAGARWPTACRRGRSAPAGRSSTAGTGGRAVSRPEPRRLDRRRARARDLEHDLDVALDPRVGQRHLLARAGALEQQVDARAREAQVAHLDAVEPVRQRRPAHAQSPRQRVGHEPQRARDEVRDRARGPRLRLARDRIGHGRLELRPPEAREELGQPVALGCGRGLEQRLEDAARSPRRSRTCAARRRSSPCRAARPSRGGSRRGCSPPRLAASVRMPQPENMASDISASRTARRARLRQARAPTADGPGWRPAPRSGARRRRSPSSSSRVRAARSAPAARAVAAASASSAFARASSPPSANRRASRRLARSA